MHYAPCRCPVTRRARQERAQQIADVLIEGFDRHYRALPRDERAARRSASRRPTGRSAQQRGAGADPLLRRARARVRRAAPQRARRRTRSTTTTWQRGEAPLHRPARRPQAAGARRDVLQLGRSRGSSQRTYVRQRLHLRPRGDLDRVHRVRPADLPELLPGRDAASRASARRGSSRDFGWSRPVRRPRARRRPRAARASSTSTPGWPGHARAELPDPGAGSAFYRNKAAYVIGKIVNGHDETAVRRPRAPRRRAAGSSSTRSCSTRSRSRSSSRSRAPTSWSTWTCPSGYVEFLQSMMPTRPRSELYTMVGLGKQGKTLFYRDLLQHLHHSRGPCSSRRPARAAR